MHERFERLQHTRTTVVEPRKLFDTCRCAEHLRSGNTERSGPTVRVAHKQTNANITTWLFVHEECECLFVYVYMCIAQHLFQN
jgi:hypothetical protein